MAEATPGAPRRPDPLPPKPQWPRRWFGFPTTAPPLIGREREIASLLALLRQPEVRLLTLIGAGGIGKTRLAIGAAQAAAPEFGDGAVFVPLDAVTEPPQVLPAIARALHLAPPPDRTLAGVINSVLHDRALLILDTMEHLLPAAPDVLGLLDGCPRVGVLVTSREPLHLACERCFQTPPLTLPATGDDPEVAVLETYDAIALFVDRARAVRHDFALTAGNAAAVTEICRRLDGLPLAIELAASWVRVLPPPALLDQLQPRLPLLHGGSPDRPARLRTMHDAIAWSYDRLPEDEARLVRRLGVFVCGFTLDAAAAVAGGGWREAEGVSSPASRLPPPASVLDLLAALVDKSLVQSAEGDPGEPRFAMLETVREFARERLAESGEEPAILAAHAAAMAEFAEWTEPRLLGPDENQWHERVAAELGNLRAALAWGLAHDPAAAMRMSEALYVFWAWSHIPEGRRWLDAALAIPRETDTTIRARAMAAAGGLATLEGDPAGVALTLAGAEGSRAAGDHIHEARARWLAAAGLFQAGNPDAAVKELDESLRLFATAATPADRALAAYARAVRGAFALILHDREAGIRFYEEALAQLRDIGAAGMTLIVLGDFAGWLVEHREPERARGMLEEALALAAPQRGNWLVAAALIGLALVDAIEGEGAGAARRLGAAAGLCHEGGLFVPGQYQTRIDRATTLATETLGTRRFETHWDAGRADPWAIVAEGMRGAAMSWAQTLGLTSREAEVWRRLGHGRADKEIAAELSISSRTVSHHVAAILAKLGARSRAEAAVRAVRDGVV